MRYTIQREEPVTPPVKEISIHMEKYEYEMLCRILRSGLTREGLLSTPETYGFFKAESQL